MLIRDETAEDARAIHAVVDTAFRTAPVASGTEAEIVDRLRAGGALTLSLVAEQSGKIVGHIAVSPTTVGGKGDWGLIGPMAVLPEVQSEGIGSALMNEALGRLRAAGRDGAALVGDPAYYGRFGFRARPGLTFPGVPDQYVLALPFSDDEPAGELSHHEAFGLDK